MSKRHEIPATHESMVWGYLDSTTPPVLEIASGETVTLHSFPAGGKETLPEDRSIVPPAYLTALDTMIQGPGPHFITGPVYVKGAQPGDTLQVDILDVKVSQDWGFVSILPLLGTLPDEFTDYETIHPKVDHDRQVCIMPWGTEIALDPFFGIVATAPPPAWGRCGSPVPRSFGGNMDNKELVAGSTLYLPVWVPGANFSVGDGHGRQGDGEVCVNALEMGLTGTFTFVLHKAADFGAFAWPRAETPNHYVLMGFNEDLDLAMKQALRQTIDFITARSSLTRVQAYQFCSLAVDFRVTQTVNGEKGVHALLKKGLLF